MSHVFGDLVRMWSFQVLVDGKYDRTVLKEASQLLNCQRTLDIDAPGVAVGWREMAPSITAFTDCHMIQMIA